jgi:hypothetical protein
MTFIRNAMKIAQDVQKEIEQDERMLKSAMTRGMRDITNGAKLALRADIQGAGLGAKLSKSWRGQTYPKGKDSFSPAGFLNSNAPHIIHAFEEGPTVTANSKKYLAIPTDFAKRRVGRNRLTPEIWAKAGFPPLRFVPTRKGGLLVTDGFISKSQKSFRTGKAFRGGSKETLVMFILVKSVKHKKKLDSERIAFEWYTRYPTIVDKYMAQYG